EKITALYDLELVNLGDPLADLASIRVRDINEPISNVAAVLARYEAESGEAIDWPVLSFYTALLFIAVPMISQSSLHRVSPHPAFVEYLSWSLGCSRTAVEAMAEKAGIVLEPVPQVTATRGMSPGFPHREDAFRELLVQCRDIPAEGFLRCAPALSLAQYLARLNELGPAIDLADREDARVYLGVTGVDGGALESALDDFVRGAAPERDGDILRFFHRRARRRLQLLGDYPGPIVTRGLAPVGPGAQGR